MSQSHKFAPEAFALLTMDGDSQGYVTVADNAPFFPGAFAWLFSDTQPSRYCLITDLQGTTRIGLRFVNEDGSGAGTNAPSYDRSDCSAYLVVDNAKIDMPAQVVPVEPVLVVPSGGGGGSLPPLTGQQFAVLMEDPVGVVSWRRLTQDMLLPGFTATLTPSFSLTREVGSTLVQPAFTASYNRPAASATLNDGTGAIPLTLPATAFAYDGSDTLPVTNYTKSVVGQTVTWTLSAFETGGPAKTSSVTATWRPLVFFDVAVPPGVFDEAFIESLTGTALAAGFARTIAFGAGSGTKKLYYAFPSSFGTPSAFIDQSTSFPVPFTKVASGVSVTNAFGVTLGYDVWESDNFLVAAVTIVVS